MAEKESRQEVRRRRVDVERPAAFCARHAAALRPFSFEPDSVLRQSARPKLACRQKPFCCSRQYGVATVDALPLIVSRLSVQREQRASFRRRHSLPCFMSVGDKEVF